MEMDIFSVSAKLLENRIITANDREIQIRKLNILFLYYFYGELQI